MGIQRDFGFGIGLYNFSFAYSNLTNDIGKDEKIVEKADTGISFLASVSRELFIIKVKNGVAKRKQNLRSWVFSSC